MSKDFVPLYSHGASRFFRSICTLLFLRCGYLRCSTFCSLPLLFCFTCNHLMWKYFHRLECFWILLFVDQYLGSSIVLIKIQICLVTACTLNESGIWVVFVLFKINIVFSNLFITSPLEDKAFITVKHRKQQVLETVAGKRSYRLSAKVKAFPSPEVLW